MTTPTQNGIDVRAAVADFHARYYSANLMTAAVYGRHTLDELQQLVVECFSPVASQDLKAPEFPADVFTDEVSSKVTSSFPLTLFIYATCTALQYARVIYKSINPFILSICLSCRILACLSV